MNKRERMLSLIEEWHQSNLSIVDFCKQHSITIHSFYYWNRKYKEMTTEESFSKFLPLKVSSTSVPPESLPEIHLNFPNGVTANIQSNKIEFIQQLIKMY